MQPIEIHDVASISRTLASQRSPMNTMIDSSLAALELAGALAPIPYVSMLTYGPVIYN